jgi:hypothetical protein
VTSSGQNTKALKAYVYAALEQWKYTLPFLRDKNDIVDGVQIIYSVDTDVVKLFTNPIEMAAPVKDRGYGYLQLFVDDKHEECIARGRVIAEHIFRTLQHGAPLLVIPPLTRELADINEATVRRARDQQFSARDQLRALKNEFESARSTGDHEQLFRLVSEKAPDLIRLLEGASDTTANTTTDATAELRRFSVLFRDKLVAAPEFFVERRILETAILAAFQPPERNLPLDTQFDSYRTVWSGLLIRRKVSRRKKGRDVDALARIQLINQLLPPRTKLIHITGDAHVLNAGDKVILPGNSRTFTERYLRHPRAFLAEPGMLSAEQTDADSGIDDLQLQTTAKDFSEFSKWLIVFLAKFWKRDYFEIYKTIGHSEEELSQALDPDDAIEKFCDDFPDIVSTFRNRWDDFSRNVAVGQTRTMIDSMPYMKGLSAQLRTSIAEIDSEISSYIDESWRASFQFATATSYGITRISSEKAALKFTANRVVPRSIPFISFETFKHTQQFIKQVIEADSFIDIGEAQYKTLLAKVNEEDTSGYLYYLAYASLFAAEGRWGLAKILAERSFELRHGTSLRHSSPNENITGREAAYFCAVAIRNSAKTTEDLTTAERWIERAQQCWEKDKALRPSLRIGNLRFAVERASILAAKEFFFTFDRRSTGGGRRDKSDGLMTLQAEFKGCLSKTLGQLQHEGVLSPHERWVTQNLQRRVLVNLLMIGMIKQFYLKKDISAAERNEIRQYYALLSENVSSLPHPSIKDNYLYNLIWLLSTLWLGSKRVEATSEAKDQLTDEKIEAFAVMPYDKERLIFFREVLGKIA